MSLAFQKLAPISVWDPRLIQQERVYPVLKGASDVLYKPYTTNSVSSSAIQFSCPPSSNKVYVDRRVWIMLPCRLYIQLAGGVSNAALKLIAPERFALRSFPIHKALETVNMTMNSQNMSINIADMVSALEHFNHSIHNSAVDYSKCPTYPCSQSQNFSDLYQSIRSPMGQYDQDPDGLASVGFPWTLVSQTNDGAGNFAAVIDFVSCEPLMLSPLFWGGFDHDDSAFLGLKTLDFNFTFSGQCANRMFAIDAVSAGVCANEAAALAATVTSRVAFSDFTSNGSTIDFSYTENQPYLLFQYLTPQGTDKNASLEIEHSYPYYTTDRFISNFNSAVAVGADPAQYVAQSIQLQTIPSKIYIYLRNQNSVLQKNPFLTDTFMAIQQVSIQWGNRSGLLSSCNRRQLYDLSVKNGCMLSWVQWSGEYVNNGSAAALAANLNTAVTGYGSAAEQYGTTGSILALDPLDLGMNEIDAPGKIETTTLQVTVTAKNVSGAAVTPSLYVVVVSQGVFTLHRGIATCQIGVLTSDDILRAHNQSQAAHITYAEVRRINGGNYLCDLKNNLHGVLSRARKGAKAPVAHVAKRRSSRRRSSMGGKRIGRKTLKKRLH